MGSGVLIAGGLALLMGVPDAASRAAACAAAVQRLAAPIAYPGCMAAFMLAAVLGLAKVAQLLRRLRACGEDAEPPSMYPEGTVFVSQRVSEDEFYRLGEITRERELQKLFRTEAWREHIRRRGPDEANYNWQLRKRLGLPDSPSPAF